MIERVVPQTREWHIKSNKSNTTVAIVSLYKASDSWAVRLDVERDAVKPGLHAAHEKFRGFEIGFGKMHPSNTNDIAAALAEAAAVCKRLNMEQNHGYS